MIVCKSVDTGGGRGGDGPGGQPRLHSFSSLALDHWRFSTAKVLMVAMRLYKMCQYVRPMKLMIFLLSELINIIELMLGCNSKLFVFDQ